MSVPTIGFDEARRTLRRDYYATDARVEVARVNAVDEYVGALSRDEVKAVFAYAAVPFLQSEVSVLTALEIAANALHDGAIQVPRPAVWPPVNLAVATMPTPPIR